MANVQARPRPVKEDTSARPLTLPATSPSGKSADNIPSEGREPSELNLHPTRLFTCSGILDYVLGQIFLGLVLSRSIVYSIRRLSTDGHALPRPALRQAPCKRSFARRREVRQSSGRPAGRGNAGRDVGMWTTSGRRGE